MTLLRCGGQSTPKAFITEITAPRWSDADADHACRLQPFPGRVLDPARLSGFTAPAQMEMGSLWCTP